MHCVNLVSNKPDKLHPWVVFEGTNSDSPTSEPTSHMRQKVVLDWKQAGERENKTWKPGIDESQKKVNSRVEREILNSDLEFRE